MANRHIDFSRHERPVRLAAKAIGMDHKRPYMRAGKLNYRPYRNYFTCKPPSGDFAAWMGLVNKSYATHDTTPGGMHRFELTRAGLYWLGNTLGVIIHDPEKEE